MFLLWSLPMLSQAATIYIDPAFSEINKGDSVTMSVRLNVDEDAGECVNAVDAVISYTDNISPEDVSIGGSIFSVWVEQPTINREDNTITFAGGMPNGYCGRVQGDPRLTNTIAKLVFRSPGFSIGGGSDDNEATVELTELSAAYLNDGQGTKADLRTLPAKVTLNKTTGNGVESGWLDEVALDETDPEEFSITLNQDTTAFGGKHYIVFNTSDKQTGIDYYEVIEEPISDFGAFKWGGSNAPWIETRSPYVLNDQTLNVVIRVRAVDKAGNEYVATLVPEPSQRKLTIAQAGSTAVIVVIVLAFAVAAFFTYRLVRRRVNLPSLLKKTDATKEKTENFTDDTYDEVGDGDEKLTN